jgi:hypothetical protein
VSIEYDGGVDAFLSYQTWAAAKREMGIREGTIEPRTEAERKWARHGPVPVEQLQAGRR